MRFFLTSYQKSGTHQIMPMFLHDIPDIVDQSGMNLRGADRFGIPSANIPYGRFHRTAAELRSFSGKRFGHVAYMPEYAKALRHKATRMIFNVRDPRDVVAAEYESMRRSDTQGIEGLWNMMIPEENKFLIHTDDPIAWLIRLAAVRWPNWLGWFDEDFVRVVHYEDLRTRTVQCVQEIRQWMPTIPMQDEAWMIARAGNTRSATFRKGLIGEHRQYFTEEHWRLSDELLTPILEQLGYNHQGRIERALVLESGRPS